MTAEQAAAAWLHDMSDGDREDAWRVLGYFRYAQKFAAEIRVIDECAWAADLDRAEHELTDAGACHERVIAPPTRAGSVTG